MNEVVLTPAEIMQAAMVGIMRNVKNIARGNPNGYGAGNEQCWQIEIEGALGECALAKWLGVYWWGYGDLRAPDVAGLDVRTTCDTNRRLILHKGDPDDRVVFLLAGVRGRYLVRGWIRAGEGKRDEFWQDPTGKGRHAYFVPVECLHSPQTWKRERIAA